MREVADVALCKQLRSVAATHDGRKPAGTAVMLVGENAALCAASPIGGEWQTLPRISATPVYDREIS